MRILALAIPLALSGLLAGLTGCSAGPERSAAVNGGVGFGDYQRYLNERANSRTSAPYSVAPETTRAPMVTPATMPAPMAPGALPPIPALPVPAGAPLSPPINTQALAPMSMNSAQPAAPAYTPPAPAYAAAQPAAAQSSPYQPAPYQPPAQQPVAASLVTPAATPDLPPSTIRDAQIYQEGSVAHGSGAGPAPAQIVAVTSVPPPSSGGPNLMAYALANTHPVGTEIYRRLNPLRWSRWESACLQFRTQDAAQTAFLANGGPERDRDNLDPDGDGYACWWDPAPLRQAVTASR